MRPLADGEGHPYPCNVDSVLEELLADPEDVDKIWISVEITVDGEDYESDCAGQTWSEGNARMIHSFASEVDATAMEGVEGLGQSSADGPNRPSESTLSPTPPSESAANES